MSVDRFSDNHLASTGRTRSSLYWRYKGAWISKRELKARTSLRRQSSITLVSLSIALQAQQGNVIGNARNLVGAPVVASAAVGEGEAVASLGDLVLVVCTLAKQVQRIDSAGGEADVLAIGGLPVDERATVGAECALGSGTGRVVLERGRVLAGELESRWRGHVVVQQEQI